MFLLIISALHAKKIHPEMFIQEEPENSTKTRKRRSCRVENMQKVHVVPEHLSYDVMKHIVMKTVNERKRRKRNAEFKKLQKRNRRKKRELKKMMEFKKIKQAHNIKKRQAETEKWNKNPSRNQNARSSVIGSKRQKRGIDELMDKMDKEHEKYVMYNWNPNFNIHDPILMFEEYRHHLLKGKQSH